jgi:GNAT superfamily N-acetyltransferase
VACTAVDSADMSGTSDHGGPGARRVQPCMAPMTDSVVRTYLELTDPSAIRAAKPPRIEGDLAIQRVDPPDGATSRWFYEHVGAPHQWTDNLGRTTDEWQAWADNVETWVATVDGERAGYYELRTQQADVEIAYFGLLPHAQGRGLGGYLLTHALRRAFALRPRAWVHTCTLDGPHALPNYTARGLTPYRTEALPPA